MLGRITRFLGSLNPENSTNSTEAPAPQINTNFDQVIHDEPRIWLDDLFPNLQKRVNSAMYNVFCQIHALHDELINSGEYHDLPMGDKSKLIHLVNHEIPSYLRQFIQIPHAQAVSIIVRNGQTAQDILLSEMNRILNEIKQIKNEYHANKVNAFLNVGQKLSDERKIAIVNTESDVDFRAQYILLKNGAVFNPDDAVNLVISGFKFINGENLTSSLKTRIYGVGLDSLKKLNELLNEPIDLQGLNIFIQRMASVASMPPSMEKNMSMQDILLTGGVYRIAFNQVEKSLNTLQTVMSNLQEEIAVLDMLEHGLLSTYPNKVEINSFFNDFAYQQFKQQIHQQSLLGANQLAMYQLIVQNYQAAQAGLQ